MFLLLVLLTLVGCEGGGSGGNADTGGTNSTTALESAKCLEEQLGWLESGEVEVEAYIKVMSEGALNCDLTNAGVEHYIEQVKKVHPQFLNDYLN